MKTSFPETLCFAMLTFLATVYALTPTTPIEATDDATFLAPSTTPTEAAGAQTLEAQPHEVTAQPVAVEWLTYGEALSSGKPILLHFGASYCGPCKRMEREVFTERTVVKHLGRFACVKLDMDAPFGSTTVEQAFRGVTGGNVVPREVLLEPGTRLPLWSGVVPADLDSYLTHLEEI